jgi:hypothetical protein
MEDRRFRLQCRETTARALSPFDLMTDSPSDSKASLVLSELHRGVLRRKLREAPATELEALVKEHLDQLGPDEVSQILRNSFVTAEILRTLAQSQRITSEYDTRRELTFHPRTPEVFAQRFISTLRWRDLARLVASVKTRPLIRRQAEMNLGNRLPGLSLGEKISLARIAGIQLLHQIKNEKHPRIIEAMLDNPRLTEGVLLPVMNSAGTAASVLQEIARSPRWANRYEVRLALVRNPNTPLQLAMNHLSGLKKNDLRALGRDRRLRAAVRDRARLLCGGA